MFLTSNHCFQLNYESISIICFLQWRKKIKKNILSESADMQKTFETSMSVDFDERTPGDGLFTGGSVMDYGLIFWPEVMV